MRHVAAIAADVGAVLAGGAAGPDPAVHGLTTAEERATCSAPEVLLLTGYGESPVRRHAVTFLDIARSSTVQCLAQQMPCG